MKIDRKFTEAGKDAYADVEFVTTVSEIRNPDGTIVFKLDDVEVPKKWSQVASDVIAQKYFRKAGVPTALKKVKEKDVPEFLWRSVPATDTTEKTGEISASKFLTVSRAHGLTGAGRAVTSQQRMMRAPIMTKCATCLPRSARRRTLRNGLIQGYIGHMALMDQGKATFMWITSRVS